MAPSGFAVDAVSGLLTREPLACAEGLLHNHLINLSDQRLSVIWPIFNIRPRSPLEKFEK